MGYFKHEQALVEEGASVGEGTRIWAFCNIQKGATIGANCNICDGCFVEKGAKIGNNVKLKNQVSVFEGITLEDGVFIGAHTVFINDRLPRAEAKKWELEKVTVHKGATVGANATVMGGLKIGTYAFVGAGSVVTKDVPPYTLVYGNPARAHGYVCQCGEKLPEHLKCSCGKTYALQKGELCLES